MLVTKVLVSDITDLSDARYCAGMGVDLLGFALEPGQPSFINQAAFKEISGWVAGIELSGQFTHLSVFEINQLAVENHLDYVLLNRVYPLEEVEQMTPGVILRVLLNQDTSVTDLKNLMVSYELEVDFFLLDSTDYTHITEELVPVLRELAMLHPVLLGFGIEVASLHTVLHRVRPAGLRLSGGQEIRPGYKDFDGLAELLELLEAPE